MRNPEAKAALGEEWTKLQKLLAWSESDPIPQISEGDIFSHLANRVEGF